MSTGQAGPQVTAPGPASGSAPAGGSALADKSTPAGGSSSAGASWAGPRAGAGPASRAGPGVLRRLAAAAGRQLELIGSQCCVGRADAAWRRTRDREPPE